MAGNATVGRRSTPTASPSSELDSVTTPTTNIDAAATTSTIVPTKPMMVVRLRFAAIAVTSISWYNERFRITSSTGSVTR